MSTYLILLFMSPLLGVTAIVGISALPENNKIGDYEGYCNYPQVELVKRATYLQTISVYLCICLSVRPP